MSSTNGNVRRVLMLAGANFVHSVVFRQVEYLRRSNQYTFSAFGFGNPKGRPGHTKPSALFDRFEEGLEDIEPPRTLKSAVRLLPYIAYSLVDGHPYWDTRNWKERALQSAAHMRRFSKYRKVLSGYDLYHWHCFAPERLPLLKNLQRDAKVIITLWGSDLYRTAGITEYARQFEACHYATVFTMATPEMETTFLAKFGHHWAPQIRLLNYGACNLESIDLARPKACCILREFGIPSGKIVVSVGNSAGPGSQHLAVLGTINRLGPEVLQKIAILLPMTYAVQPSYLQQVREVSSRMGTSVTILDKFLPTETLSALRCCTDITIHVPISDQFSAWMSEALYAGSVLITGSWLPYGRLRSSGVHFHEIAAVPQLTAKLAEVMDNLAIEKRVAVQNAKPIWEMMAWESVTPKWLALYDEVLNK